MFSILIPTFNNINYLKVCLDSLKKNSQFQHQIIIHINEGSDGTLGYVKEEKYDYTFSKKNIGMPKALNKASKKALKDYILISHDDFYFCPNWDVELYNEVKSIGHNNFYLSGIMIGAGQKFFDAGSNIENFNEKKLLDNLDNIKTINFQGTTKCPGLIHITTWNKVNGWSEEFSPTGGDDTDFAMKLWKSNIRIFKGLGRSLAYHFGSVTTRKKSKELFTYLGSRGNKIFLKKWGMSINFFEKHYLRSGLDNKKKLIFKKYDGPLNEPNKNFKFYLELIKNKLQLFYLNIVNFNLKN